MSDLQRPPASLIVRLRAVGSATASTELRAIGVRDSHILGPASITPGIAVAGPAVTLQFMPKREDLHPEVDVYADPESQLHRHALYAAQAGDVVVVDARGDMSSGVFGEMMLTYFRRKGGAGVVVDGSIRDVAYAKQLGLGVWVRGATPNFHVQTNIVPFAVNVPVACGGRFVAPGDVIVADDDGAVVVPAAMAADVADRAEAHAGWEEFSRERLEQGGDLRKYYPIRADAQAEYEAWRARRSEEPGG